MSKESKTSEFGTTVVMGSLGQLGSEVCRQLGDAAIGLHRSTLDVTDFENVRRVLTELNPSTVINAAGYTQVDRAEDQPRECWAVNADAVANLSEVCEALNATLVQISTDYVFGVDETRRTPYRESEKTGALNVYGRSKVAAEDHAKKWERHFVVRTCGLYGNRAPGRDASSFVDTMLKLGHAGNTLRIIDDQVCSPSYIPHLVQAILFLIQTKAYGTYHVTNGGAVSWYEFAAEIFQQAKMPMVLERISSRDYGARAVRPSYSVLETTKYRQLAGSPPLVSWRSALGEYFRRTTQVDDSKTQKKTLSTR